MTVKSGDQLQGCFDTLWALTPSQEGFLSVWLELEKNAFKHKTAEPFNQATSFSSRSPSPSTLVDVYWGLTRLIKHAWEVIEGHWEGGGLTEKYYLVFPSYKSLSWLFLASFWLKLAIIIYKSSYQDAISLEIILWALI